MLFRKSKPAADAPRRDAPPVTRIAAGTRIDGNVGCDGEIHVDGTLRGNLKALSCLVTPEGLIEGEIAADDIIVQGCVKGPLQARHVHLQDGATVEGDITSETIAIDTGARLSGAVWQSAQQAASPPALTHAPGPALFSETLWGARNDDDERPLRAVRPRAQGNSFR